MSAPWDQQEGESGKAYKAFLQFRDLGPDRSLQQAYSRHTGGRVKWNPSWHYVEWSRKYKWLERAHAWDDSLLELYNTAQERTVIAAGEKAAKDGFLITAERTKKEMASIAYTHLRDVGTWDAEGNFRVFPADQLSDQASAALKSMKVTKTTTTTKQGDVIHKVVQDVELYDKINPLYYVGQNQLLWGAKQEVETNTTTNNFLVLLNLAKNDQTFELMKSVLEELKKGEGNGE